METGNLGGSSGEVRLLRVEKVEGPSPARSGDRYLLRVDGEDPLPGWGDRVKVEGRLRIFSSAGGGTVGSLWAEEVELLETTGNPFLRLALCLRRKWEALARDHLPPDEASLLSGILLGDYRRLAFRDLLALRSSGLIHLCAASGLHVGLLAAGLFWLGGKFTLSRRFLLFLEVPLLVVYALAAGLSVPVLRASVVLIMAGISFLLGRDFDFLSAAGAAVFYLFLRDTNLAVSPSFQLSFAAALGVVLLRRPLGEMMGAGRSRVLNLLSTSLAAQAAVAPLLLHHFGEVPLLAPLSNLLVLPVLPFLMGAVILSLSLGMLGLPLAHYPLVLARPLARWILAVAGTFSSARWSLVRIYPFSPLWALIYFPLLYLALLGKGRLRLWARIVLATLVSLALFFGLHFNFPSPISGEDTKVTFLDVGQGDSCLIQTPEGISVLVDGGKDPSLLEYKLRSRGLRSLDAVIVSHPEKDHAGGLEGAFKGCAVGLVVHPPLEGGKGYEFLSLAEEMGIPAREMKDGDALELGSLKIDALAPSPTGMEELPLNDRSLAVMVEINGLRLLLPGDVEEAGQEYLMRDRSLSCDLLKVPHHGGFAEGEEDFLELLRPEVAIISVGADNPYGHPSRLILQTLRKLGCAVYRTDLSGDIVVHVGKGGFRVETSRQEDSRGGEKEDTFPGEEKSACSLPPGKGEWGFRQAVLIT